VPPEPPIRIGAVPEIQTAQDRVHPRLESVVQKHLQHLYQRSPTPGMQQAFAQIYESYRQYPIILDTGCGRGHSTRYLAQQYPRHMVLGLDKSVHRLQHLSAEAMPDNARLLRVELVDFWLLAQAHQWHFEQVYLLYPNPWPKTMHLQRRWQGHAVFPAILETAQRLILRTNWQIYAEEFALAAALAQRTPTAVKSLDLSPAGPFMSAFERKYVLAGQPVYAVEVD
jgi:tRNA (guanine-N7-)-methyltransferase